MANQSHELAKDNIMEHVKELARTTTKETIAEEFKRYFLPFAGLLTFIVIILGTFFWYIQDNTIAAINNVAVSLEKLAVEGAIEAHNNVK